MIRLCEMLEVSMPLLWRATWQGTVVIAVVLLVHFTLGRRLPPAWRFALWGIVIIRLLTPVTPPSPTSLFNLVALPSRGDAEEVSAANQQAILSVEQRLDGNVGGVLPPFAPQVLEPSPDRPEGGTSSEANVVEKTAAIQIRQSTRTLTTVAGLVWLSGIGFFWIRGAVAHVRLRKRMRSWCVVDDPDIVSLFQSCQREAGVQRGIQLRMAGDGTGPAVAVLFRPCVVLPQSLLRRADRHVLRHVLLHELIHIRRRDLIVDRLAAAAATMHWFNPMVHFAVSRMRADRELACDAAVLGLIGQERRAAYGETVLTLASQFALLRPLPGLVGVFGSRRRFHERIDMIARYSPPRRSSVVAAVVTLLILIGVGLTDVARTAPVDEPQAAPSGDANTSTGPPPFEEADSPSGSSSATKDEKPFSLRGIVQVEEGELIENATVRLYQVVRPPRQAETIELLSEVKSDAAGEFRFTNLAPPDLNAEGKKARFYSLTISHPGVASATRMIFSADQGKSLDIMLKAAGTLRGRVTDGRGKPIAEAAVYVTGLGFGGRFVPDVMSDITDADGRYEIADLAAWDAEDTMTFDPKTGIGEQVSQCFFRVYHPDYGLKLAGYSKIPSSVDVQLEPAAVVEGRVVDRVTGEPAVGATVSAQGVDGQGWQTTAADAAGRYRLTPLVAGKYNIWAAFPDRTAAALDSLSVAAGETKQAPDIELITGGFIAGRVLDGAGKPISRTPTGRPIQIGLHGPSRPRSGAAVESVTVSDDGTYHMRAVPGENFPYVMTGEVMDVFDRNPRNALKRGVVVNEGSTTTVDFHANGGAIQHSETSSLKDTESLRKEQDSKDISGKKTVGSRSADASPERIEELIATLRSPNIGEEERWASAIRELALIGAPAVPALVGELDRTTAQTPLRSLAFTLRAIDDPRAVPALIRAVPRTLVGTGSDFGGLGQGLGDVTDFMREHDLDDRDQSPGFSLGRPFREVIGALHAITGQKFNEAELNFVFVGGGPKQRALQRQLFENLAQRWATWWESNSRRFVDDTAYVKVNLPPSEKPSAFPEPEQLFPTGKRVETAVHYGGVVLGPPQETPTGHYVTFRDLDTGRGAAWPEELPPPGQASPEEIAAWAEREGFDVMGVEYRPTPSDQPAYLIKGLGLQAWRVEEKNLSNVASDLRQGTPPNLNRPVDQYLADFDREAGHSLPGEDGTFLFVTREGARGVLRTTGQITELIQPEDQPRPDAPRSHRGFYRGVQFDVMLIYEKTEAAENSGDERPF